MEQPCPCWRGHVLGYRNGWVRGREGARCARVLRKAPDQRRSAAPLVGGFAQDPRDHRPVVADACSAGLWMLMPFWMRSTVSVWSTAKLPLWWKYFSPFAEVYSSAM